jgi:hypothetical protein
MPQKPYVIADPRYGLYLQKEPWLSPKDAFRVLENCSLQYGRVEKRRGSERFDRLANLIEDYVLGTGDGLEDEFSGTLPKTWIRTSDESPSLYRLKVVAGAVTVEVDHDPTITDTGLVYFGGTGLGGAGSINLITGAIAIVFEAAPATGVDVEVTFEYYPHGDVQVTSELLGYITKDVGVTITSISKRLTITDISVANPTQITFSEAHGLETGDAIYLSNSDSTPVVDGQRTVTKVDDTKITVPVNVTVGGSAGYSWPRVTCSGGHSLSDGEEVWIEESNSTPVIDGAHVAQKLTSYIFAIEYAVTAAGTYGKTMWKHLDYSYVDHFPVKPSSMTLVCGGYTGTDNGSGGYNGDIRQGTAGYYTGLMYARWPAATAVGTAVYITYQYLDQDPCVGIHQFFPRSGSEELLAFSPQRGYRYSSVEKRFIDLTPGTPTETDPFPNAPASAETNVSPAQEAAVLKSEILCIVNGTDPAMKFDSVDGDLTAMTNTIRDDADESDIGTLHTSDIVIAHKGHLLYLSTRETLPDQTNEVFRKRARWTPVWQHEKLLENDYADAPSEEWIKSAEILRDEIIVEMTKSFWKLRYTGDFRAPFDWQEESAGEGCVAKNSSVKLERSIVSFSKTGPVEFNGQDVTRLAEELGPFITQVDSQYATKIAGQRIRELREVWLAYPTVGSSTLNRILGMSEVDRSLFIHIVNNWRCFGAFERDVEPTIDEIEEIVDEIDWNLDAEFFTAGFPTILVGTEDGTILQVPSTTYSDEGVAIPMAIETQGLNPFLDQRQPQLAKLNRIDIFADATPDESLTVELRKDTNTIPYATHTVSLTPDNPNRTKVWRTIHQFQVAYEHTVKITNSSVRKIAIDAIALWLEPGGSIRPQ